MSQQKSAPNREELVRYGNELTLVIRRALERLAKYARPPYFKDAVDQIDDSEARMNFAMNAFTDACRGDRDAEVLHTSLIVISDIEAIPTSNQDDLPWLWRGIAEGTLFVLAYLYDIYIRLRDVMFDDIAEVCTKLEIARPMIVGDEHPALPLLYPPSVSRADMELPKEGISRLTRAKRIEGKLIFFTLESPKLNLPYS